MGRPALFSRFRKSLTPSPRLFLSGVLLTAAFPPWNFDFLIWFALIPFFLELETRRTTSFAGSKKAALRAGIELGFWMSLGCFFWVAHTLSTFGQLPLPVGIAGLLAFALVGEPQFALIAPLIALFLEATRGQATRANERPRFLLGLLAGLSLAYASLDWALPKLFVDTLGHALYRAPWLRQAADLGGAPFLTALIFFVNGSIAFAWLQIRDRSEPSVWPALKRARPLLVSSTLLLVILALYGANRLSSIQRWMTSHVRDKARFAVIQANIGDFDKISAERGYKDAVDKVIGTYLALSDEALQASPVPDFIVWPETAFPSTFRTPTNSASFSIDQKLESFVTTRKASLIFGGYDRRGGKDFNSIFFLTPRGVPGVPGEGDLLIYHKNLLLMFGEYLPGADLFPSLKNAFPMVGNFGRGPGPENFRITGGFTRAAGPLSLQVSPVICYEALFPRFASEPARQGAEAILNVTNDGWFGPWAEPELHLALTTFRSIETRRPQVRATNTGISTLILPTGEITQPTTIGKPEILLADVPLLPALETPQILWGDWFAWLGLLPWLGLLFWATRRKGFAPSAPPGSSSSTR